MLSQHCLFPYKLRDVMSQKRDLRLAQLLIWTTTYARSSPIRHVGKFSCKGECLTFSNLQISVQSQLQSLYQRSVA